jgi:hypothetical protein
MNNDWGAIKGIFERHGHNVAKARKTNAENASPLRNFHKPVEQLRQQRREASQKIQPDNFVHHKNRFRAQELARPDTNIGLTPTSAEGHAKLVAALSKGSQEARLAKPAKAKPAKTENGFDIDDSDTKVVLRDTLNKAYEPNRKAEGINLDQAA